MASLASSEAMMLTIGAEMPAVSQVGVRARRRRLGHQAAQAGGFAGQDGHRLPFGAEAAAVDPGNAARRATRRSCSITRFEVVGAVDDHIDAIGQCADVAGIDVGDERLDRDLRVDGPQLLAAAIAFGSPPATSSSSNSTCRCRLFSSRKSRSTMPHMPHAGAHERVGDHSSPALRSRRPSARVASRRCPSSPTVRMTRIWRSRRWAMAVGHLPGLRSSTPLHTRPVRPGRPDRAAAHRKKLYPARHSRVARRDGRRSRPASSSKCARRYRSICLADTTPPEPRAATVLARFRRIAPRKSGFSLACHQDGASLRQDNDSDCRPTAEAVEITRAGPRSILSRGARLAGSLHHTVRHSDSRPPWPPSLLATASKSIAGASLASTPATPSAPPIEHEFAADRSQRPQAKGSLRAGNHFVAATQLDLSPI